MPQRETWLYRPCGICEPKNTWASVLLSWNLLICSMLSSLCMNIEYHRNIARLGYQRRHAPATYCIILPQFATAKSPKSNTSCSASGAPRDWQLLHSRPPGCWHRAGAQQKRQPYCGRSCPPHNPWPQPPISVPIITHHHPSSPIAIHHHPSPIIAEQLSEIVTRPRTFLNTFHPVILCQSCKQPSPASAKTSNPNKGKSGLLKLEANLLKWAAIDLALLVSSSFRIKSFQRIGTVSNLRAFNQQASSKVNLPARPLWMEFLCHNTNPPK